MSAGGHSCPDISHSQLQSELVCKGQDTVFIFLLLFAYIMHQFTSTVSKVLAIRNLSERRHAARLSLKKQSKFAFPSKGSSFTYLMRLIQT